MQCRSTIEKLFEKMFKYDCHSAGQPSTFSFHKLTLSPFFYAAINELLRQCAPFAHDCLFQQYSYSMVSNCLLQCSPHHIIYRVLFGYFAGHIAGSMKVMYSLYR